ncbi:hypothetical protein [Halioglobus sp. Uisw_031]|uniref:hypothetical protein n=1 Tax=Halioglobus sp. Uisw_031 TaxID=3230977 RepID=UPI0039EBB66A
MSSLNQVDSDAGEAVFLKLLFSNLNAGNVRYAVMRNGDSLPMSLGGSDLDILFDPSERIAVLRHVNEAIRQAGGTAIGCADTIGFTKVFAFGRSGQSPEDWWGARLDLSFGFLFSGSSELMAGHVLTTRVDTRNDIPMLSGDLAATIGVIKEVLHNSSIPSRYVETARQGVLSNWPQLRLDLDPMGQPALSLLRELCLDEFSSAEVTSVCAQLRKDVKMASFRRSPARYMGSRAKFEWSKVRRYLKPPGVMLAMLGTDGAGKSTIISAVEPVLEAATHGDFTVQHLRPTVLPPLSGFKGQPNSPQGPVTDPHGSVPSGKVGSMFRILYLATDYFWGYWFSVRPKVAKSPGVYLFDRYAYDMSMDPIRFRIALPGWVIKSVVRLVPKPDIVFCLVGDPGQIADRKRELPLKEVTRQVAMLREYAEHEPRAVLVSTDDSIDDSRDQVLNALLEYCVRGKQVV